MQTTQQTLIDVRHPNYLHFHNSRKSHIAPIPHFATRDGEFLVHENGQKATGSVVVQRSTVAGQGEMTINMGMLKFLHKYLLWQSGDLIQHAFPELSAEEREFLMTGITPERWNELFPKEDA